MKQSLYNIFIPISTEETLVFNGMSKKFFTFSSGNISKLKEVLGSPDKYSQLEEYQNFTSMLRSNGFIIDDTTDEFGILKKLFINYKEAPTYSLMILTTYACNFSCWYCVQKHKPAFLKSETIARIKKHIPNYLLENGIKSFEISWFGGEPLLNFKAIREISMFSKDFCVQNGIDYSCGITTNGSLITPAMAIEMKEIGFDNYQITIDGNRENHNKTRYNSSLPDSFSKILDNIKLLAHTIPDVSITVRFNYTHKNLTQDIFNQVDSRLHNAKDNIRLLFRKVWQEPETPELSANVGMIMNMFKLAGYEILHDCDDIRFTSCYVEQTHYNAIFPDGTVDKCSNQDISETRGRLSENGNIVWDKVPDDTDINIFNFPSECIDCQFLPLCMGPCPRNRKSLIYDNKIHCQIKNKEQEFYDSIRNFALIKQDRV